MSTPTRFSTRVSQPEPETSPESPETRGEPSSPTQPRKLSRPRRRARTAMASLMILTAVAGTGEIADLGLNDGDVSRSIASELNEAEVPGAEALEDLIDRLTGHDRGYTRGPWRAGAPTDPNADPSQDLALAAAGPNTSMADPSMFADTVAAGEAAPNYAADARGYPIDGMDSVDLSATSPGGGLGPQDRDWSTMAPYELSIPGANLAVGLVDKGVTQINASTQTMDLPVSFQAGVLSTTAPVSADRGTTVIAGHVNWSDGSWAPMSNLYLTRPGMAVTTSDGHGGIKHWKITGSRYVDQHELSNTFSIDDPQGPRRLLMVTCKSSVVNGQIVYDHNLVVTATPA